MTKRKSMTVSSVRGGTNRLSVSWKEVRTSEVPQKSTIDREIEETYTDNVPVSFEPDMLLVQLNKFLAASGLSHKVTRAELEKILAACNASSIDSVPFIDPVTNLQLPPPPPAEVYAKHWQRLPKRYLAEDFLEKYWGRYTTEHPHMLFASHLRLHDPNLEAALRERSRKLTCNYNEFIFSIGILNQHHVFESTPPTVERQAKLFRSLITRQRLAGFQSWQAPLDDQELF